MMLKDWEAEWDWDDDRDGWIGWDGLAELNWVAGRETMAENWENSILYKNEIYFFNLNSM